MPTKKVALFMILSLLSLGACSRGPQPPVAAVKPHELTIHGDTRVDDYFWLDERDDPEVLAYLEAENAYLDEMMAHTRPLQETLYDEMVGRIKKDDATAPYELKGYWYYTRYVEGGEYPLYCRRPGTMDGDEQVMLDGNAMGAGEGFFSLRGVEVSPDGKRVAYGVDTVGRRFYTLRIKDLATGAVLPDEIPDVTANVTWAMDDRTLFYTKQDPETLRSFQIWRHVLGTPVSADVLVYEEKDDTFSCHVRRSKSDAYLFIVCDQTLSTEYRYLEADDPTGEFRVFQERQRDLEYGVSHQGDRFLVRTNLHARNFRLMETPLDRTWLANWTEVVPHREDVLLEGVEVFTDYLALEERRGGLTHLRILDLASGRDHDLDFGEPTWTARASYNPQMDSRVLRYEYTSLTTPMSTYAYDMASRAKTLLKQTEVLGGFDRADYREEYLRVPARDGTLVPVSLVYRTEDFRKDGTNPLLLYGYGSYGISSNPYFDPARLSLLDRGFVFAIAHVRGGEEMGRQWYEDGKLLKKMNTFTDFIDVGHHLVDAGYTATDRLFARGGSAGGLLMGAVVNLDPDLWRGVYAAVPFVDVVTTMLDESIPLTTAEYDEWGNPNEKVYYDYMLSYSPYDNVEAKDYPALLVTTGLHDSQVQYFEPAKWVAKLRALKTGDNPLLLKINMEAGHGGKSGRFRRLEERALAYAFMLDLLGRSK